LLAVLLIPSSVGVFKPSSPVQSVLKKRKNDHIVENAPIIPAVSNGWITTAWILWILSWGR